jgi:hypothetical protein
MPQKRTAQKQLIDPSMSQRIPEGFLLSDVESVEKQFVFLWIISLFWTITSGLVLFNILRDTINPASILIGLFLSIFVLIGLLMLGASLLETWKTIQLHPAELVLPSYPLRLGESCSIRYQRRRRQGSFTRSATVEAKLICDEWVQYTQGTDTVTKTHALWEQVLSTQTVVSGEQQAYYTEKIHIRPEGPPSFLAEHNKIRWQLIIKLRAPGIPSACISTFSLKVLPEQAL